MSVQVHASMYVRRVRSRNITDSEPPLDPKWSDLEKLRWKAGLLLVDTGIRLRITTGGYSIGGRVVHGVYGYVVDGGTSGGAMDFDTMWAYINGVEQGYRATEDANRAKRAAHLRKLKTGETDA